MPLSNFDMALNCEMPQGCAQGDKVKLKLVNVLSKWGHGGKHSVSSTFGDGMVDI